MSRLDGLAGLPRDEGGPVFREPWEARAFAMAVELSRRGVFTWSEWTEALGREIAAAGPDDGSLYYERWLLALEKLTHARIAAKEPCGGPVPENCANCAD